MFALFVWTINDVFNILGFVVVASIVAWCVINDMRSQRK